MTLTPVLTVEFLSAQRSFLAQVHNSPIGPVSMRRTASLSQEATILEGLSQLHIELSVIELQSNCTPSSAQPDYLYLPLNPKIGHAPALASPALEY